MTRMFLAEENLARRRGTMYCFLRGRAARDTSQLPGTEDERLPEGAAVSELRGALASRQLEQFHTWGPGLCNSRSTQCGK